MECVFFNRTKLLGDIMTSAQINQVIERLDKIDEELKSMRLEMAETRGAWKLAKFVIALLGVSGLGGITAWLAGQGK